MLADTLESAQRIHIRQRPELMEFLGAETRNKYEILDDSGAVIGFAAEQGKDLFSLMGRYFFGHWRQFEVAVFDNDRKMILHLDHAFRWFFQRVEVASATGQEIGALQRRFSILQKSFDFEDVNGNVLFEVRSPLWRPWSFPVVRPDGRQVAIIQKRWSGILKEALTDADNFTITFEWSGLSGEERSLILAAALYIDLQYFERYAGEDR